MLTIDTHRFCMLMTSVFLYVVCRCVVVVLHLTSIYTLTLTAINTIIHSRYYTLHHHHQYHYIHTSLHELQIPTSTLHYLYYCYGCCNCYRY